MDDHGWKACKKTITMVLLNWKGNEEVEPQLASTSQGTYEPILALNNLNKASSSSSVNTSVKQLKYQILVPISINTSNMCVLQWAELAI